METDLYYIHSGMVPQKVKVIRNVACGRADTDRRADKHDEANSRFSHFGNAPKKGSAIEH
jgi:hypothetical protein